MDTLRRVVVVLAVVVTGLTACDSDGSSSSPPDPTASSAPTTSSPPSAEPSPAPMPGVPLRYMYARGPDHEGVLISAAGTTETGLPASAYVATRTGAVFASGDRVYDLVDGGTPAAIGPVTASSVFFQADPTLRYVSWEARTTGSRVRMMVYDIVAQRRVFDRVLPRGIRPGPVGVARFGAARLRLVHMPAMEFWSFATVSGRTLVTPGGQVVDLATRRVSGPQISRGLVSPGLRYRVSGSRGGRAWEVLDLRTGRSVTPAQLLRPEMRAATLTGWLGRSTFGVIASSGSSRDTTRMGSVCRVSGRCQVMWRVQVGVEGGGLQGSNEIG